MSRWAACISSKQAGVVAGLRLFSGIEAASLGDSIWLRGPELSHEMEIALHKIPETELFALLEFDRLRPWHSRIPDRSLPTMRWQPVKEAFPAALPVAALPGENRQKLFLTLTRSVEEKPTGALLTTIEHWTSFATTASVGRLASLRFAAAEDGQALIIGSPLPFLSGTQFTETSGVLVPCGFMWSPAVDAIILRKLFGLGEGDVVVLFSDNTHQVIRSEQFASADRSSARATWQGWKNPGETETAHPPDA